jgi:hypothetical protein
MGCRAFLSLRYHAERTALQRDERAPALVTASDTANLRLASAPGVPAETHARYRGRPGAKRAVLTLSPYPSAPAGQSYQPGYGTVRDGQPSRLSMPTS